MLMHNKQGGRVGSKSGRRPALRRIRRAASGAWDTEPETAVVLLLSRSSSMLTSFQSLRICLTVLHAPSFSLLFFPAPSLAFARKLCRCVNPQRQFFRTWVRIGIHCVILSDCPVAIATRQCVMNVIRASLLETFCFVFVIVFYGNGFLWLVQRTSDVTTTPVMLW